MERFTRETFFRNSARAAGGLLGVAAGASALLVQAAGPERPKVASENWLCFHPNAVRGRVQLVYARNNFLDWYAKIHADLLGGPRPDIRGWWEGRANAWLARNPGSEGSGGLCQGEAAKVASALQGDEAIWWQLNDPITDESGTYLDSVTPENLEFMRLILTVKHAYDTPRFFLDSNRLNLPYVLNAQRADPSRVAIYNTPDNGISSYFTAAQSVNGSNVGGWRAGVWIDRNMAGQDLSAWFPQHYKSRDAIPSELRGPEEGRDYAISLFEANRPPADLWNEKVVDFCAKGVDILRLVY